MTIFIGQNVRLSLFACPKSVFSLSLIQMHPLSSGEFPSPSLPSAASAAPAERKGMGGVVVLLKHHRYGFVLDEHVPAVEDTFVRGKGSVSFFGVARMGARACEEMVRAATITTRKNVYTRTRTFESYVPPSACCDDHPIHCDSVDATVMEQGAWSRMRWESLRAPGKRGGDDASGKDARRRR